MNIEHNTSIWSIATNRHKTSDGYYCGWIKGCPGDICWSDSPIGTRISFAQAEKLVEEHNAWLEEQTPISIQLIKLSERLSGLSKEKDTLEKQLAKITKEIDTLNESYASLVRTGERE